MSNVFAIATVTSALAHRLEAAIREHASLSGATVHTRRPDSLRNLGLQERGANLFLYRVSPSAALRNADLPTRGPNGNLRERPRVALDLHYIISCFGRDDAQEPQQILGIVARELRARPILTAAAIERARIAEVALDGTHFLLLADLDEAVETVKITPLTLTTDELSKLWGMFPETPYHLSIAYQASVVILEGDERPVPTLPVTSRSITGRPFRAPSIDSAQSGDGQLAPIVAGGTLVLEGTDLLADPFVVLWDGVEVVPDSAAADRIEIALESPDVGADLLVAGVHGIRVTHPIELGDPPALHHGATSNTVPFLLRPKVPFDTNTGLYEIAVVGVLPDPDDLTLRRATIVASLEPPAQPGQEVCLLLNELVSNNPASLIFDAPDRAVAESQVTFAVSGVRPGTHLLRIQVDGADSPLVLDSTDTRHGPKVTL